jgi:hypothetical protein
MAESASREVAYPPNHAAVIADAAGGDATDKAASSFWPGVETDVIRPVLVRLAMHLAEGNRRTIFLRWLAGESQSRIAEDLGITRQAVSKSLHGAPHLAHGGSVEEVRALCLRDDEFLVFATGASTTSVIGFPINWFAGLNESKRHLFVPLVVLFVFVQVADKKNQLSYSRAREILPPWVLSVGIQPLKALRYIDTDGVTIRILRTPITEDHHR